MKNFLSSVLLCLALLGLPLTQVEAQSNPGWPAGYIPTAAEWAAAFSSKQDVGSFPSTFPAANLTGPALPASITSAPGLASVAGGPLGTAAFVNTGATGHFLPYLDGTNVWGNPNTFGNNNIRVLGSGAGYTTLGSLNASSTNFGWLFGAFNGTALGFATGTPPVSGQCPQFSGTTGLVISIVCSSGGGGSLTIADGFADSFAATTTLNLLGSVCSSAVAGTVTCATTAPPRLVPGVTATVTAADMGNAIVLQGASGTITVPVQGTGLWGNGQTVLVCNEASTAWTITVTSGTGQVIIEPSNPPSIPGTVNGIPACMFLTSDGTNLHPFWGANAPNSAFLNQYQAWLATQATTTQTPTPSGSTFTPVLATNNNVLINLTTGCTCVLANFTGTISNDVDGLIKVKQPASGSAGTLSFGAQYVTPGGTSTITLATALGSYTFIPFHADATSNTVILGSPIQAPTH